MSKVEELNKLALKLTGENPYKKTIKESLEAIASYLAGENIEVENIEDAIQKCTEYYSGGGGSSYPPDWSEIGYETAPEGVINSFDYSKQIYDTWDNTITSMESKYKNNKDVIYFPNVDTKDVTSLRNCFSGCSGLQEIPLINTEKVSSMYQAFYNCSSLISIPLFHTENVTDMTGICSGCLSLVNVPILNTSALTSTSGRNMFAGCSRLSDASLNNILAMCTNATGVSSTYKTLASVGLSAEQATKCQSLSNYAAFTAAGWTTGY